MEVGFTRWIGLLFLLIVTGCTTGDNDRRFVGAGLDLYTPQTSRETFEIVNYLDEMCTRAGLGGSKCPGSGSYSQVLKAGFNDINKRCNEYILWIDRQRLEARMASRGLAATQGLVAGLQPAISATANTLAALLAVFSFAENIYSIASMDVLAPFETSAIKLVVEKRLDALRGAAEKAPPQSQSDVVGFLQGYLAQCTPTFIAANFNEDVRNPEAGTPKALEEKFLERYTARKADDPADSRGTGRIDPSKCPECKKIYDGDLAVTANTKDIELSQLNLCVTSDGVVSTNTLAAIKIFESMFRSDHPKTGKLDEQENITLSEVGCKNNADRKKYRNAFESATLNPKVSDQAQFLFDQIIKGLNRKLRYSDTPQELKYKHLSDLNVDRVRDAIALARGKDVCNKPIDAPIRSEKDDAMQQLTPLLVACLTKPPESSGNNPTSFR